MTRVLVQPLKVMDPDHPLAVLVQKAKQERTGAAAAVPPPEGALDPAASSAPTQQAADGELPLNGSSVHQNQLVDISFLFSLLSSKRSSGVLRLLHAT